MAGRLGLAALALAGLPLAVSAQGRLGRVVEQALDAPELPRMAAGLIDTIGGRLSGTAAGVLAETWATEWLRSFGMDSVWLEPVEMPVWRRGDTEIRVVEPAVLRGRRLVAVAYGYSAAVELDSVPLIDLGRGDPTSVEARAAELRGRALLADMVGSELVEAAAEAGAAAVIRIAFEPGRLAQARVAPVADPPAPVAVVTVSHEDGHWLRRQAAAGPLVLRVRVRGQTVPGRGANVVAEWQGDDPTVAGEFVLVGAHLDAWDVGDGALDNGTGVLVVMSVARALTAADARPRRTVRVVLFAGEELGLLGSREYVRAHAAELPNAVAMMNLDMVGAPRGFGATGHPEADSLFDRLAAEPALRSLELSAEVQHGGGPGSDHQPFLLAGVPTIYVWSSLPGDVVRWYHNAGDTMDKISLDDVRASGAAATAAVWALADHPGRPFRHLSAAETRHLVEKLGWTH